MPLDFADTTGIRTIYAAGGTYTSGEYRYTANYRLHAKEAITAFEVRCTIFDVWGEPLRTLSHTEVEDLPAGQTKPFAPEWRLYSENEASEYYGSLCFVARVRAVGGRIAAANMDPILTEATRFSLRFAAEDLEPSAAPRP
jgi:hypothetical protein